MGNYFLDIYYHKKEKGDKKHAYIVVRDLKITIWIHN